MTVLELRAGLFPDAETVAPALERLEARRAEIGTEMTEDDWDGIAAAILAADLIVTS